MFHIACTRFTEQTLMENERYRETRGITCIYGSPIPTNEKYSRESCFFVVEMNNTTNRIIGVGLIQNKQQKDRTYIIHDMTVSACNYNRYIYKSPYRLVIDKIELTEMEKRIIAILTQLLFKGACHSKCAQGITEMPVWIMRNKQVDFLKYFRDILMRHYKQEI